MSTIRIDARELAPLADALARVPGDRLAATATSVVNDVTQRFEAAAIEAEIADINLTRTYVRSKTRTTLAAVSSRPVATIETAGDLTVMGRFNPHHLIEPGAQRRAGPVKGNRSAGVGLFIRRSAPQFEPQWFMMPLRGTAGLYGVFVKSSKIPGKNDRGSGLGDRGRRRDGVHGYRHIYGPAPYSLFAHQIEVLGPQLADDLESTAIDRLRADIERAIA